MIEVTFQPATIGDLDFAHDVTKANMESLVDKHYGGWDSEIFKSGFGSNLEYIIFADGEKIGFMSYSIEEDRKLFLRNLQLVKEKQGQGFGTIVMKKLENVALKSGCESLILAAFPDNPAYRFYKGLKYLDTESRGTLIMMKKNLIEPRGSGDQSP